MRLAALALVASLAVTPAAAQIGGAANIAGVVTDDSGGALPGVTVTITNTATGRAQTLITNSEGRYRAVALQPGPYEVDAELQGFATVRRGVTLVVGADATLDVRLGVASLAETITVTGETHDETPSGAGRIRKPTQVSSCNERLAEAGRGDSTTEW